MIESMPTIIFTSSIIGVVAGLSFYLFVVLPQKKKRIKEVTNFLDVLLEDAKVRMSQDASSGAPYSEIPGNIDEALVRYYRKLPPYRDLFKYPVSELMEKVDWTINPREFFLEKDKK